METFESSDFDCCKISSSLENTQKCIIENMKNSFILNRFSGMYDLAKAVLTVVSFQT